MNDPRMKTALYFVLLCVFVGLPVGRLIFSYGQLDPKPAPPPFETQFPEKPVTINMDTTTSSDVEVLPGQPVEYYINEGLKYYQQQDYQTSLKFWLEGYKGNHDNPMLLSNIGSALIQVGKASDAIPLLEQAVKLDPENQLYKNNLAWAKDVLNQAK